MKNKNQEELSQLKNKIRLNYSNIKSAYCPALDSRVIFNSDGFHHLCYDNNRSERSVLVQRNKLNAFKNVVKILSKTTTIQEYRSSLCSIGKEDRHGLSLAKFVEWFGFWAIINLSKKVRIKIVVRRIGQANGQYHFWSVMPFWQQNKDFRNIGSNSLIND
ncbi:MAG TPA: hypothetical protein PLT32_01600 [bacterium]|nr:hypothetical protein [bacterium]